MATSSTKEKRTTASKPPLEAISKVSPALVPGTARVPTGKRPGGGDPSGEHRILDRRIAEIVRRERAKILTRFAGHQATRRVPPIAVSIWRITPDLLLENRWGVVEFWVSNRTTRRLEKVWVRAWVEATHSLEPYAGLFEFPIDSLEPGQSVSGALSFKVPRADLGNVLSLELCQNGDVPPGGEFPPVNVLASDKQEFDVGARFSFRMDRIHIRHTASHHEDTVLVSFSGTSQAQSWTIGSQLGDQNDTDPEGLDPLMPAIGPWDVLPNSEDAVFVNCLIANAGHTSTEEDAKKALLVINALGAAIATAVMTALFPVAPGIWAAVSAAMEEAQRALINWALADCDTVVLLDGRLITAVDAFLYSQDPHDELEDPPVPAGWVINCQKKAGDEGKLTDWLGGGCEDSDYATGIALHRQRAPEFGRFVEVDGIRLVPGQTASFWPLARDLATVLFTCDVGKITPMGAYKAPTLVTERKYDIVRWDAYEDGPFGRKIAWSDFAVVLLD